MNQVERVIDHLINGNLSDVREIFKALPGQEAAHLAVLVITHLPPPQCGDTGLSIEQIFINLLSHD